MAARSGRRAQGDQRLQEFYLVSARLFHQKGYQGTTLEEVAAELGLSKASIYHYVPSKEALLYQTHKWLLAAAARELDQRMEQVCGLPPAQRLREMLLCHLRFIMANVGLASTLSTELRWLSGRSRAVVVRMRHGYEKRFLDVVMAGAQVGVFSPHADRMILLLIFGAMNRIPLWYDPQGRLSAEQVASTAVDYLLRGLLAAPWEGQVPLEEGADGA